MSEQERRVRYAAACGTYSWHRTTAHFTQTIDAVIAVADAELDAPRAEVERLTHLLGSHADGHRCTCTMVDPGVYHGANMHPPEWEQDPWCPTHPDVDYIRQQYEALRAENAMLRSCRDSEQRAATANAPIVAAATEEPRMWAAPDAYGEPTIWHDVDGTPQPILVKSALTVGQRWLWDVVVARLTGGAK